MDSLTDYIKKAFEYKDCGDYKLSIDYFYKALAIDNNSAEIMRELAFLYSALGQYDRAISLYEQVIAKNSCNYAAKFDFSKLLKKMKNYTRAKELLYELYNVPYETNNIVEELFSILFDEKNYDEIITLFKTSKEEITSSSALYLVGLAYSKNSCIEQAQEYFSKSFSVNENNINAGYNLAKLLFDKELYSEARKLLLELLKYSEDDRVFYLLAEIEYENKQLENSIKYYSYAIKTNPREAEYYFKLGVVYSLKGFMDEAEQTFCKAITIEPDNVLYNYTLAYLYFMNKKMSLAENLVDYVLSNEAEHMSALSLKLLLLLNKNEVSLAKSVVKKLEALPNKDDFAYYSQAVYYYALNLWQKAINFNKKAIELNPLSIDYKYELAKNYFELSEFEKSFEVCNEIIEKNNKYVNAYILRSKISLAKCDCAQAFEDIDRALKLDMNSHEVFYIKGCVNYYIDNYEQALENFKTALSINPKNVRYYQWVGRAYYQLENYSEAYFYFKEAADIEISNPEYRYYMAKCCINNNDKENAFFNFSVLKRLAPANIEYAEENADYLKLNGNAKAAINVLKSTYNND